MNFNSDNSSQNITLPTIGVIDKVLYTSVFSNNLISNLPITSGILTASNITASSNISIAGSLLQTNAACNIYIAGNVGIGTTTAGTNCLAVYGTSNYFSGSMGIGIAPSGTAGDLKLATMTASGAVTIGGAASLTNTITQTGGGAVSISGPTTFTSNLTQSGGTVTIGGAASLTNTITQTGGGAVSISGPTTFTSNLTISTTNSNALSISNSSSTGLSTINLINNNNNKCYIGIGGTNTFNYSCNLYLQADNSIIFNTNGSFSTNSNPVMLLSSSNYVSVNDLWLNGQSIFYTNGEKQFPPRAYDSSPSSATYNTNASLFTFCNPTGTSVYTLSLIHI